MEEEKQIETQKASEPLYTVPEPITSIPVSPAPVESAEAEPDQTQKKEDTV